MLAKRDAPSEAPTKVSAVDAASAASFHPLNAQISAGARRPSGRWSHCRGGIALTVPKAGYPRGRAPSDGGGCRLRAGRVLLGPVGDLLGVLDDGAVVEHQHRHPVV